LIFRLCSIIVRRIRFILGVFKDDGILVCLLYGGVRLGHRLFWLDMRYVMAW